MKRVRDGYWIYRTRITTKRGKVLYAAQYGLKAFRLWIKAA
jgi:hypothetical protein